MAIRPGCERRAARGGPDDGGPTAPTPDFGVG